MFCGMVSLVVYARVPCNVSTWRHFVHIGGLRLPAIRITGRGHGESVRRGVDNRFFFVQAPYFASQKLVHALKVLGGSVRDETDRQEITKNGIRKRIKRAQGSGNRNEHKHKKRGSDQGIRAEVVD
jgi:hypothetical protein